ncbi:hypothetical protein TALC_00053 [Thermoplasmatales archaeon BRNA1]|nr:hypothetical protein TALC_00053 [Thermoplasmatales archaeon BRNA1]
MPRACRNDTSANLALWGRF